ncbi:MAG: hypothetical protein HOV66_13630, partial [Streptomycetaceae bacterium]|nr:hypothetical protein [Streptomycetaceae bacterium]
MSADEPYADQVHALLTTAFDSRVPTADLVPAAVERFRRHRRRTRAFGTAGATLAVVGALVAGTVLPGSLHRDGEDAANLRSLAHALTCDRTAESVDDYRGAAVYTGDQRALTAVCVRDVMTLRQVIGDPTLVPVPVAPGVVPGGPASGGIERGYYTGAINGIKYEISLAVTERNYIFDVYCSANSCPPTQTLADGRPATKETTDSARTVVVHYDARHTVVVRSWLNWPPPNPPSVTDLPYDFDKMIADPRFARLLTDDVHDLRHLTRP